MLRIASFVLACALASAGSAQDIGTPITQSTPILTIDSERLFAATQTGQSISAELERDFDELAAENRRIEAELAAEELALTEERATLDTETFRTRADAFDQKVQAIRLAQDAKRTELLARQESEQKSFLERVTPILSAIGNRYNAVAIIERRNILLAADGIDITEEAIVRVNQAFGSEAPSQPAPPTPEEGEISKP